MASLERMQRATASHVKSLIIREVQASARGVVVQGGLSPPSSPTDPAAVTTLKRDLSMGILGARGFEVPLAVLLVACLRRVTLVKTLRRTALRSRAENQVSTALSQEALVGVKWKWNRGSASNHAFSFGVKWVELLSRMT